MITHPEKVLFPEDGITKGELAGYYESIAPVMLPHIRARPLTMERYPAGIGKKGFWQKDVSKGFPEWLARVEVPKKDGTVHHPLVTDARSLLWMANQNTITPHVWVSRAPKLYYPDVCVFDLDPPDDKEPDVLRVAALALRDLLNELGLRSWVKTSGSKGFHILLSLDGAARTQEVARFAAAYAVRARRGAPVSAPCTWEEIEGGGVAPRTFTLHTMADRVATVGDLWADIRKRRRGLKGATEKLTRLTRTTRV